MRRDVGFFGGQTLAVDPEGRVAEPAGTRDVQSFEETDTISRGAPPKAAEPGAQAAVARLVAVLDAFAAPPIGVHAVFPQRKHLPLRACFFFDVLKHTYGRPGYWGQD